MPQIAVADVLHLSIPEKIQLVEDLWDSISVHPEQVELTPAIKSELDKRLEKHLQHPDAAFDWDDVRVRLWKAL